VPPEGWEGDPWTIVGEDGKVQLLVVGVEEELTEAAQGIIKLMYEGAVPPGLGPVQLAKVQL
jgi:hypothetical protein